MKINDTKRRIRTYHMDFVKQEADWKLSYMKCVDNETYNYEMKRNTTLRSNRTTSIVK